MEYKELIRDDDAFSVLRGECNTVFDTTQRLPGKVFRKGYARYYAFEHGQILRKEFAAFLANVARTFADRTVNYMTLEPDPEGYYRKRCGFYGLASFEPVDLIDDYIKVMSREGHADSFRVRGGDVGVLWGGSSQWGIFCDRSSWELCLMGSSAGLDESIVRTTGCMETMQLKSYISSLYPHRPSVALEFVSELKGNYPTLG